MSRRPAAAFLLALTGLALVTFGRAPRAVDLRARDLCIVTVEIDADA